MAPQRPRFRLGLFVFASAVLACEFLWVDVFAKIPEPDHIFWGTATADGSPLPPNSLVSLKVNNVVLATFTATVQSGNQYVLRVPMDSLEPRLPGTARPGDEASFFVDGELVTSAVIGNKGEVQKIDLIGASSDLSLSIDDVQVVEPEAGGTEEALFTVSLSTTSGDEVTVDFTTMDDSALAGADYVAANGSLSFPPNTVRQTIRIAVLGDGVDEPTETYYVNLTNPANASLHDAQGRGTVSDEPPVVNPSDVILSIDDVSVDEGTELNSAAVFTVSLDYASNAPISLDFDTVNLTATSGTDYVPVSSNLVIPAGVLEQQLTVFVTADSREELNESFLVRLSNPSGGASLGRPDGTATILDDDGLREWFRQMVPTTETLRSVDFVNDQVGWSVGDNGAVFRTTDGGKSWTEQDAGTSDDLLAVHFLDVKRGWVSGAHYVARTVNGGRTWKSVNADADPRTYRTSLFAISSRQAWAPAHCPDCETRWFYRYTVDPDGSVQEEILDFKDSAAFIKDIYFTGPDDGWAVGDFGQITRVFQGTNMLPGFRSQSSSTGAHLNAVFMLDENNGWAVGDEATLLKTTDGGLEWTPHDVGIGEGNQTLEEDFAGMVPALHDVYFVDEESGWVVGDNGLILASEDGGQSWFPQTSGVGSALQSVVFSNPGYAVGGNPANAGAGEGVVSLKTIQTERFAVEVNQGRYQPGDTLVVALSVRNPGADLNVDFYLGALLPNGETVLYASDPELTLEAGGHNPASWAPIVSDVDLTKPFHMSQGEFLTYEWSETDDVGSYTLFLAATVAGAMDDGVLRPRELLGLSTASFNFSISRR